LSGIPREKRTAHYSCCAALADPTGAVRAESEGICCGRIRETPAGTGGFGYDPLFEVVEYHRTFGEMGGAVKAVLSHRARALQRLVPQLLQIVRQGEWRQ
jgi:XTP/dITP diphosphohydrolase